MVSSVVDEGVFVLMTWLLHSLLAEPWLTAVPVVTARVISSVLNFYTNYRLVFHSRVSTGKAFLRYAALAVPQLMAQVLLTYGCYALLGITPEQTIVRAVIYALVMICLFVISFYIQQRWVFHNNRKRDNEYA